MADNGLLIKSRILEFVQHWNTKNFTGICSLYHPGVRVLPLGGNIVSGQEEAVKDAKGAQAAGVATIELTAFDSELLASDTCLVIGKWKWHESDGQLGGTEKFVTIWKLVDDQWLIYVDIFNTP